MTRQARDLRRARGRRASIRPTGSAAPRSHRPGSYAVEATRRRQERARHLGGVRTAGAARRRTSSCSSATACRSRTAPPRASCRRASTKGRYGGELAIDDMPHMALVSTSGTDSVVTDSANSASAYTTGHKSCVNALGVYCARNKSNLDHPKVETISELVKRTRGMSVGVVTNTEIEDATPAAMVAHNRLRADYNNIVKDVLRRAARGDPGRRHAELPAEVDARLEAHRRGRLHQEIPATPATPSSRPTPSCAAAKGANKLLGLFNTGNIDGALDRFFLKKGNGREIPRPARPHRPGARRARRAVEERQRLRADGRVRPHRQVFALARLGARGLRHHHARQRREGRQGLRRPTATTR